MLNFFILCSRILKDGGEIHMILEEVDFKSLNLKELAASVNIFVKKAKKFDERYCVGYSPTHVNVGEAKIYVFELKASAQLAQVAPGNQLKELTVIRPETKGNYSRIQRVCETMLGLLSQNVKAGGRFVHGLVSMCQTKGVPLIPMRSAMPHNFEKALIDLRSQASAPFEKALIDLSNKI
ncbi:hypothetical protein Tco_0947808, partial [Tanacetum coccineum]